MTLKKLIFVVSLFCCFTGLISLQSYTLDNKLCVSECAKKDSNHPACTDDHQCGIQNVKVIANGHQPSVFGKSFWCYTNNGWQYCSPNVEQDYQGK